MSQVNVRQLFEDKQERLQLSRVAGADGTDRIIDSDEVDTSNKGLIGHLNLIHPNWVQVLSETELDYLRGLSAEQRDSAFRQIEQNGTTCLIVAGTTDIPPELINFADQSHIPLFASPKASVHLMWLIRHYLAKELAESTTRHGVFLDVLGVGVMITGESAVGKRVRRRNAARHCAKSPRYDTSNFAAKRWPSSPLSCKVADGVYKMIAAYPSGVGSNNPTK